MPNLRRRIIGAVSQMKLPLLPTAFAGACTITAVTRVTYDAVLGTVSPLAALAIGGTPMAAFVAAVAVWSFTPPVNERPMPARPTGPRNARQVRPIGPNLPRNTYRLTRGETAMRSNLNGTYLNGDGSPRDGKPATGDGASRQRKPIPGREVRYLRDDLDRVAEVLPNYSRWSTNKKPTN